MTLTKENIGELGSLARKIQEDIKRRLGIYEGKIDEFEVFKDNKEALERQKEGIEHLKRTLEEKNRQREKMIESFENVKKSSEGFKLIIHALKFRDFSEGKLTLDKNNEEIEFKLTASTSSGDKRTDALKLTDTLNYPLDFVPPNANVMIKIECASHSLSTPPEDGGKILAHYLEFNIKNVGLAHEKRIIVIPLDQDLPETFPRTVPAGSHNADPKSEEREQVEEEVKEEIKLFEKRGAEQSLGWHDDEIIKLLDDLLKLVSGLEDDKKREQAHNIQFLERWYEAMSGSQEELNWLRAQTNKVGQEILLEIVRAIES